MWGILLCMARIATAGGCVLVFFVLIAIAEGLSDRKLTILIKYAKKKNFRSGN